MLNYFYKENAQSSPWFYSTVFTIGILLISAVLASLSLFAWGQVILLVLLAINLTIYATTLSHKKSNYWQLLILPIIVLAFLTATYHADDVEKIIIFSRPELHPGGEPFTLTFNIGKTFAGYLLLAWLLPLLNLDISQSLSTRISVLITLIFSVIISTLALFLLNLSFAVKSLLVIMLFLPINALTTCISEEAFARLAIQTPIQRFLNGFISKTFIVKFIPLALTTSLFVLLHPVTDTTTIFVFGIAGFLYGLIYLLTNRIFFSIVLHFLVNAIHFSFLTYPI